MARFIPSKKTEYDFNDGEKYINKIDVVQADTINNLVEAVLYQQENSLEENKVKILTVKQDYTFESSESTVSNNYNYQSFGGEQTFELIITATEAGNEIEVLEHAQISFRAAGFETYSDYTFKGNYSGEEGSIVFDDPISDEEDGFNLIKIVVHMSWNGQVASQIEISVRIEETKKTLLPPTELQFPINNESEIKFNNFDSALESANRLVIQGTRVGAFENPSLSGDITLKGGKNVTVEQDGKTITFNSENPNAILEGDITVYTDTAGEDSHTFPLEKGSKLRFHGFNTELESGNHLIIEGTRLKADGYFAFTSGDIVLKAGNGIGISQTGNEITFVGSSTPVITDYVTLGTEQTITGNKTFNGDVTCTDTFTYGDWRTRGIGLSKFGVFVYVDGTAYAIDFPAQEGEVALKSDIPNLGDYVTKDTKQDITGQKTFKNTYGITVEDPTTEEKAVLMNDTLTLGAGNKNASSANPKDYLSITPFGITLAGDTGTQSVNAKQYSYPSTSGTLLVKEELSSSAVTSFNGKKGEVVFTGTDLGLARVATSGSYKDLIDTPDFDFVTSINGKKGEVVLSKYDLGLGNVLLYDKQTLTADEQKQARDNLGIGDVVTSFNGKTGEIVFSKYDLLLPEVALSGSYNDLTDKPNLSDYVTLSTQQIVTGVKTFSSGIYVKDSYTDSYTAAYGSKYLQLTYRNDIVQITYPMSSGTFALRSDITWGNLSGKPSWIGSSKPSYSASEITNAVTLNTDQTVSGHKTFTHAGGIEVRDSTGETALLSSYEIQVGIKEGQTAVRINPQSIQLIEYRSDGAGGIPKQFFYPATEGTLLVKEELATYTSGTGVSISSSNVISTTAASSSASGHVTTGSQTFAGRKTFNGGINIPSGATLAVGGDSGFSGYVLTSNGMRSAPSWKAVPSRPTDKEIGLAAHPIGSYYISNSSTSPASLFGGSWTSVTGRFLYCNAGTSTGGSNTHTLTVSELPSHAHGIDALNGEQTYAKESDFSVWTFRNTSKRNVDAGPTKSTGGGSSFSIMPAYQTVYAWRRTA